MDALNNVFFSINVFLGCLFNIVAIALVVKKRNESQNKYYTFMLFLQFGMAIISTIVLGYLRLYLYVIDEYLVTFLRPLSHPPSNDFIHISLIGFVIFLLYFNITIPTGLIAARFSIVCTNNGFKRNSIIRVLGLCITLTIIQAFVITFSLTEHVSSNIIINAIKKYNIESDILTESTAVLGRKISDLKFLPLFIITPTYFTANYFFIIYFVRKYKLYIKEHKDIISSQTQKMNKEVMTILIVQAFTPVCLTGGPVVTIVTLILIQKIYIISFFINNIIHLLAFIPAVNGFLFTILLPSNRKLTILTLRKIMNTIMCKKSNQINNITVSNVFIRQNSKISGSKINLKQKRNHEQNSFKF